MKNLKNHFIDSLDRCISKLIEFTPLVRYPAGHLVFLGRSGQAVSDIQHDVVIENGDFQFEVTGGLPIPGWHMLELSIEHDQPSASVRLYLDYDDNHDERGVYLPVKNGRVAKRLIYVYKGLKKIRLELSGSINDFTISDFKIVWLTPRFAHDRLAQRLSNMHYAWRYVVKSDVVGRLKDKAREGGHSWHEAGLFDYEETFQVFSMEKSYQRWLASRSVLGADKIKRVIEKLPGKPSVSVVLVVFNPEIKKLEASLKSVVAQLYPYWQLCVVDDDSSDPLVHDVLRRFAKEDSRIHVEFLNHKAGVCLASNKAIENSSGDYIAFLDQGDTLSLRALFHVAETLHRHPSARFLYSDEDSVTVSGEHHDPRFKPDWNPDFLYSWNYIGNLSVYREDLVKSVGCLREDFEGAYRYDLLLRCAAHLDKSEIVHIPHMLYHALSDVDVSLSTVSDQKLNNQHADNTGKLALQYALSNIGAKVDAGPVNNTYRVQWPLPDPPPKVSLLVPTRDRVEILRPCVDAILERTDYPDIELLILDNQSRCSETLDYMREVEKRDSRVRVLRWSQPFNYSAINNFGARHASGEILGLVNNDIEPINSDWLREMVSHACRSEIGCVGAKLYYPNETIQHAGVILGLGGVAGHSHRHFPRNHPGYDYRLQLVQNLSAVTAACLLLRKSVFDEVGGLNEAHLAVAYNDVDLCLKVDKAGYRNLWTPYAELYHHESVSRGQDNNAKKRARAAAESNYMRNTWGHQLDHDPAYNPNLTLVHEDFSLR